MCDTPSELVQCTIDTSENQSNHHGNEANLSIPELSSIREESFNADLEKEEGLELESTASPLSENKVNKDINKSASHLQSNDAGILSYSSRSTRSKDNPEFVAKQKSFIAKVQAASSGINDHLYAISRPDTPGKRKRENSSIGQPALKRKKNNKSDSVTQEWQNDSCCWECHREGQFICCEMCPRVFHLKCAGLEKEPEDDWACSECHAVMQAENVENRSRAMQLISVDQLCVLLKYALKRLQDMPAMEPFCNPVDEVKFPTYWEMVIHPVDFTTLERNIKKKFYGSTEAFISDARWIVHNSVIFNGANSKVTSLARTLIRILKQELSEIETCPDCYENAHCKPESWFTEACRLAHPLVWAKLKGFPYWPAKAVKWKDANVDVRFFGRHDRSWVPLKECFLFSEQMPSALKNKNKTLETCLIEVEEHIGKLKEKFGKFNYAAHRTPFNPYDLDQIRVLLPLYKGAAILRIRSQSSRSISRQSGHSGTDDETSSITSTDSGSTSFTRLQKKSIQERFMLNTPDTDAEADFENFQNEEDNHKEITNEKRNDSYDIVNNDEDLKTWNATETEENENYAAEAETEFLFNNNADLDETTLKENISEAIKEKLITTRVVSPKNVQNLEESVLPESVSPVRLASEVIEEKLHCREASPINDRNLEESCLQESVSPVMLDSEGSKFDNDGNICMNTSNTSLEESKEYSEHSSDQSLEVSSEAKLKFLKSLKPRPLSHKLKLLNLSGPSILKSETKPLENGDIGNKNESVAKETLPHINDSKENKEIDEKDDNQVNNLSIIDDLERINMLLRNDEINDNSSESEKGSMLNNEVTKRSTFNLNDKTMSIMNKLSESIQISSGICPSQNEMKEIGIEKLFSSSSKSNIEGLGLNDSQRDEKACDNKSDLEEDDEAAFSDDDQMQIDEGSLEKETEISKIESEEGSKTKGSFEEDYFQGFLNEINLNKKVETTYTDIFTNSQDIPVVVTGKEASTHESESVKEGDLKECTFNADTPDDEADRFNEQLLSNSSLTIGKVSQLKSPKQQNPNTVEQDIKNISKIKEFLPSIDVKSVVSENSGTSGLEESKDKNLNIDELKVKKQQSKISSAIDFKNYASKIFHNITISSKSIDAAELREKSLGDDKDKCLISNERKSNSSNGTFETKRRSSKEEKTSEDENSFKKSSSESLLEAVRLVQNIGNIAIKRVDNKTLEHTSGNDSVTISVANDSLEVKSETVDSTPGKSRTMTKKEVITEKNDPLASIRGNGCVSVSKASEPDKEKVKMPSGVDTTRLSPSISITPVSSAASPVDKQNKYKSDPSPTILSSQQNMHFISSASPVMVNAGNTTPCLTSASPTLHPPPVLSHPLPSPNSNVRTIFSPHLPGLAMPGGSRTPITSPGLRMMGNPAGLMMTGRHPGPPHQMIRHLPILPPEAGSLSNELHKHSQKLAEMMRNSLEDVLAGLVGIGSPEARLAALQLELERSNWRHQQELVEVRHNADVMLVEIRANLEAEKLRAVEEARRQMEQKVTELRRQMDLQFSEKVSEVKRQAEMEKQRSVEETKKKQWCANCGKEALFFCCWNTSYCDYPCQQSHWPQHMSVCGQNSDSGGGANNSEGGSDSMNGDASCHSSRGATPVQNLHNNVPIKNLMEDEDVIQSDDRRRRKRKEDQSPIYSDGMGRAISPAYSGNSFVPMPMGGTSPIGQPLSALVGGSMRTNMGAPSMAAMAAMAGSQNTGPAMKMPHRFMQHTLMQQQPMFAGMDPRMIMMMSRNMGGPSLMMRGPPPNAMHTFRPRFM